MPGGRSSARSFGGPLGVSRLLVASEKAVVKVGWAPAREVERAARKEPGGTPKPAGAALTVVRALAVTSGAPPPLIETWLERTAGAFAATSTVRTIFSTSPGM